MQNEREMKAFIFSSEIRAREFHEAHYFSHYDKKEPNIVCSSDPYVISHLRREATEIPYSAIK